MFNTLPEWAQAVIGAIVGVGVIGLLLTRLRDAWRTEQARKATPPQFTLPSAPHSPRRSIRDTVALSLAAVAFFVVAGWLGLSLPNTIRIAVIAVVVVGVARTWQAAARRRRDESDYQPYRDIH